MKIRPQSSVVTIYNQFGHKAQVHLPCETVVVSRDATHCGEKHVSQDWREVRLNGVPHEVRVGILQAWAQYNAEKAV